MYNRSKLASSVLAAGPTIGSFSVAPLNQWFVTWAFISTYRLRMREMSRTADCFMLLQYPTSAAHYWATGTDWCVSVAGCCTGS